jgi:hypothetical protein
MNTLTNLLKDYRVGIWCKRAAWVVLALGILHVGTYIYYLMEQYNQAGRVLVPGELTLILTSVLSILPSIVFYFFILYAAGTIVDYFVGNNEEDQSETAEDEEEDQDDIVEDENLTPGQMSSSRDY